MRRPTGEWVTELARASGYQNGPTLPAGAQTAITLQMVAVDGPAARPLLARRRCDLDRDRHGLRAGRAVGARASASPPTTAPARRSARSSTSTSASPTCRLRRPATTPYTPEAGYTMLFDGTDESLADWTYAGGGSFVREDCTIKSVGGFGLLYTKQDHEAPYSLKLEWMMPGDDNSGVFVGFPEPGRHGPDVDLAGRGDPDRRDGQPGPDHGRDLPRAGGGHRRPRRGPQPAG